MIKLDSGNIAGDYTHRGRVTTDCLFVGNFVTEAVQMFDNVTFMVNDTVFNVKGHGDGFKYESYAQIESVEYRDQCQGEIFFHIKTKPKTIKREGWVNVYKMHDGGYYVEGEVRDSRRECAEANAYKLKVATAHVEWEEITSNQ